MAGRPALAARLAHLLAQRTASPAALDAEPTLDTARTLAARGGATTGLFAVALAGAGRASGWSAPWRHVLHLLHGRAVADVRDAVFDISMQA